MRELVVLSGKGGTGKTSLTGAFASFSKKRVLCDADVDAADLHLLMSPEIKQKTDFMGGSLAIIDQDKCSQCGKCIELCRFNAISEEFIVDPIDCEGCGVCVDFCPEVAIDFPIQKCGELYISETRFGDMAHARLGIAEENSGKLVTFVRTEARKVAETKGFDLILTDGPPGVGCSVIASVTGATAVLIVTEPTVSGLHDLERAVKLVNQFRVPIMICINKYDLNLNQTRIIEEFAKKKKITIAGKIPFNSAFTKAMVLGKTVFEYDSKSEVALAVRSLWDTIMESSEINEERKVELSKISSSM